MLSNAVERTSSKVGTSKILKKTRKVSRKTIKVSKKTGKVSQKTRKKSKKTRKEPEKPFSKFTYFGKLPPELRDMIWSFHCAMNGRLMEVGLKNTVSNVF